LEGGKETPKEQNKTVPYQAASHLAKEGSKKETDAGNKPPKGG